MEIEDVDGTRALRVDGTTSRTSVYLLGPQGWCMEMVRADFVAAIAAEFDLMPLASSEFVAA